MACVLCKQLPQKVDDNVCIEELSLLSMLDVCCVKGYLQMLIKMYALRK